MAWGVPTVCLGQSALVEPRWLKIETVRLGEGPIRYRFVHFTDVHFRGDYRWLESVVHAIQQLRPDFACFTGDLIEEAPYLNGAVEALRPLRVPLFAVPGNHDHWSRANLGILAQLCRASGGAWLPDRAILADARLRIHGVDRYPGSYVAEVGVFNLVLSHFPIHIERLRQQRCDLMLAGHSHGGQVRLPYFGPLLLPGSVGKYDLGLFETAAGRIYVNPGIGTLASCSLRFNCRPEVTLFEVS